MKSSNILYLLQVYLLCSLHANAKQSPKHNLIVTMLNGVSHHTLELAELNSIGISGRTYSAEGRSFVNRLLHVATGSEKVKSYDDRRPIWYLNQEQLEKNSICYGWVGNNGKICEHIESGSLEENINSAIERLKKDHKTSLAMIAVNIGIPTDPSTMVIY